MAPAGVRWGRGVGLGDVLLVDVEGPYWERMLVGMGGFIDPGVSYLYWLILERNSGLECPPTVQTRYHCLTLAPTFDPHVVAVLTSSGTSP